MVLALRSARSALKSAGFQVVGASQKERMSGTVKAQVGHITRQDTPLHCKDECFSENNSICMSDATITVSVLFRLEVD
jgi:hypothetical protein